MPLALQKMLYFLQGIYVVLCGVELFSEDCEAWARGSVFKDAYDVFKNFKYNPIDDIRFAMFQNRFSELSDNAKRIINLVVESFGMYSGKTLELITHGETPWKDARANCLPDEPSNEVILKEVTKKYFSEMAKKYDIGNVNGLRNYIILNFWNSAGSIVVSADTLRNCTYEAKEFARKVEGKRQARKYLARLEHLR